MTNHMANKELFNIIKLILWVNIYIFELMMREQYRASYIKHELIWHSLNKTTLD